MDTVTLRDRAGELPREPGVYQFLSGDTTVYVGKAVDLRNRVPSYADPRSRRISEMVRTADEIDFAVTDTETQALLLEANLIKRHQPRYNVRLKDDKSYPLVQLTDHPITRIEITRDPDPAATAFGPFTSKALLETVVKALREAYELRGCSDYKYQGRDRPCLDYEMGLCSAPCTDEIEPEQYQGDAESVRRFFAGETGMLAEPLRDEMETAAAAQEFERAANLRDKLETVEAFHGEGESAVAARDDQRSVDVIAAALEGDKATVARLHSESGQLVDRSRHRLDAPTPGDSAPSTPGATGTGAGPGTSTSPNPSDPNPEADTVPDHDSTEEPSRATDGRGQISTGGTAAVLSAFLTQYYADRDLPEAVLLPERPADETVMDWLEASGTAVRVPGAGREAKLVDLALKNARQGPDTGDELGTLAARLSIDRPERIEGFDVSHASGKAVVGSDVCFVGGSAEKSDYRRRKLTERNDDYANMRELLNWRASRAVEGRDDRPDPDLLLIDGGDGQLAAARDAMSAAGWEIPVISLAKQEELVITPDGPIDLDDDDPALHVLQRVRDEAHRFAVQYHGSLRDDVSTTIEEIPGVGPKTRKSLLRRFGSVDNVREASQGDLTDVPGVGSKTAEIINERL